MNLPLVLIRTAGDSATIAQSRQLNGGKIFRDIKNNDPVNFMNLLVWFAFLLLLSLKLTAESPKNSFEAAAH